MGSKLVATDVRFSYEPAARPPVSTLDVPYFSAAAGELVGITGPSGSGKTSLLHVLAALERPQRGQVRWDGFDVAVLSERERDQWRRRAVGFVFQEFHLLPGLSAIDNVLLPVTFERLMVPAHFKDRARRLLDEVRVPDSRRPVARLSRGEQQRVALARALLFKPSVLVADEPTASLDGENAWLVSNLLVSLARETGSTALIATHDAALVSRLDRVQVLVNGRFAPPLRQVAAS